MPLIISLVLATKVIKGDGLTQLSSWQWAIFTDVPKGSHMTCNELCKLTEVMEDSDGLHSQKAAYHAWVHSARLVAGTYHPTGDGLHVKIGLAALQRNDADLSLLQLKGHCIQKEEETRNAQVHKSNSKVWPAQYKMNDSMGIFSYT